MSAVARWHRLDTVREFRKSSELSLDHQMLSQEPNAATSQGYSTANSYVLLANIITVFLGRIVDILSRTYHHQDIDPRPVPTHLPCAPLPNKVLLLACHCASIWYVGCR
jgi:hypothetical protein